MFQSIPGILVTPPQTCENPAREMLASSLPAIIPLMKDVNLEILIYVQERADNLRRELQALLGKNSSEESLLMCTTDVPKGVERVYGTLHAMASDVSWSWRRPDSFSANGTERLAE